MLSENIISALSVLGHSTAVDLLPHVGSKYKTNVSRALLDLAQRGLIEETGRKPSGNGRPHLIYSLNENGASKAGSPRIHDRDPSGIMRGLLLSEYLAKRGIQTRDTYIGPHAIAELCEEDEITYPLQDHSFYGNVAFEKDGRVNLVIPHTNYNSLSKFLKSTDDIDFRLILNLPITEQVSERLNNARQPEKLNDLFSREMNHYEFADWFNKIRNGQGDRKDFSYIEERLDPIREKLFETKEDRSVRMSVGSRSNIESFINLAVRPVM